MNPITRFFQKQKEAGDLMEAKYFHLRGLKLKDLINIANEYGLVPNQVTLQNNPRGAYGFVIASSLNLDTIKKAVEELK
jgi:hypothetical protein